MRHPEGYCTCQEPCSALADAVEGMVDMIGYVPDYFRQKWRHDEYLDRARAALVQEQPDALLAQVRALHAPEHDGYRVHCQECRDGDDLAAWPCPTAEIVYTQEERDDIALAQRLWDQQEKARRHRAERARGWTAVDDLHLTTRLIYGPQTIAHLVFPTMPVEGGRQFAFVKA